ncbi:hypothetical protein AAVH_27996 [Aphelenchoides avenae]|nr:hypothetical protein AAVH_27996 [Aphelenchus avenae]
MAIFVPRGPQSSLARLPPIPFRCRELRVVVDWTEQQAIVDECIDHVVDLLLPTVKNDSTERPLLSIEFLEVFANYDGNVSHALRAVAKEAYRRCKHSSHVAQRLQSLRFNE